LYLGDLEEGIEFINRSLKMKEDNPFAIRNKGIYYVLKEDIISARQLLDPLYRDYPDIELLEEYYQKAQN
jgi:Flp pilus assembly protein TadD